MLFPEYWQANALHYALKKRIFPSIASYQLGHNKIEMTRAFRAVCPTNLPQTYILANTPGHRDWVWNHLDLPFVAKEARSSQGNGVFLIEQRSNWERYCATNELLYVQEYLPIQQDMRLVVIGRQVIAGYWRRQASGGFHNNIAKGAEIVYDPLLAGAVNLVNEVARQLNIDHAGFDVAEVNGHFYLFEFNRLFGNQGLVEQGIRPERHILEYLLSEQDPSRQPPNGKLPKAV